MELLASSGASRKKGKVAIIAKANGEEIIKKLRLKRKIKCLYYSKTPVKLIKVLNFKKELKSSVFSIL